MNKSVFDFAGVITYRHLFFCFAKVYRVGIFLFLFSFFLIIIAIFFFLKIFYTLIFGNYCVRIMQITYLNQNVSLNN